MDYEKAQESLKAIIDEEGIDYLTREPYEVYESLLECMVEPALCRTVLSALLAGIMDKVDGADITALSKWIQSECFFKKSVADNLAEMFISLFSDENKAAWDEHTEEGFRNFCESEWEYKFHGEHTWHHGGGSEDCWVDIEINFEVTKPEAFKKLIEKALAKNPFISEDAIFELLSKSLDSTLQRDMEEYIEAETYYEPYMEDYDSNAEYVLKDFCKKYGLKMTYFECDGSESGFEPDSRW